MDKASFSLWDIIRMLLVPIAFLMCVYVGKLSITGLLGDRIGLLKEYISVGGNAKSMAHSALLIDTANRVKAMLPKDACIEVSRVPITLLLSFRYYVYPLKFTIPEVNDFHSQKRVCGGNYFVDLNAQIKNPPAHWREIPLKDGIRIFAIGDSPVDLHPSSPKTAEWSGWAYLCFLIVGFLIGLFILCGLISNIGDWPLSGKMGASFLLGLIGVTFPFWVLALFRVPLSDFIVYLGMCLLVFSSYLFMKRRRVSLANCFIIKKFSARSLMLNIIGLSVAVFFLTLIISYPIGIVDEVHIWLLKAKMFFDLRLLNFEYTEMITNYYPVFWPLYLTIQFIFTQGDHDQIAKWGSALIFFSSLGLMKSISMSLGLGKKASWLVVLVFLVYFHHWTFFTALAENIFIALVLLSVAFFVDWIKNGSKGSLYATVISLVGLCGAKFEGTVIVGFFFIAFLLSKLPKLNELWPVFKSISPLLIALLMQPLWLCWLDLQGVHYSIFHLRRELTPENFLAIFQITQMYLADSHITVIIIFIAILFPFLRRNERPWSQSERFIFFLVCGMVIFAYSAGLCWTNSDFWGYYTEVWLRLVSRAMPLAVILWMSRTLYLGNRDKSF